MQNEKLKMNNDIEKCKIPNSSFGYSFCIFNYSLILCNK